jgi:2-polyprenyl-3-methyl-5-hydroxy-6-metoxy-1,4-benzoquinol methylase
MAEQAVVKNIDRGWFTTRNRPGDRTLESQLEGLDRLIAFVPGKSVLDIGCAEGLIGIHLIDKGAIAIHGIEVRDDHVKVANRLRKGRACTFETADANTWVPKRSYSIVTMLAVLHKLVDPTAACKRFAEAARELVVIRLPPYGSTIVDARSENKPFDIAAAMGEIGWLLDEETRGPFDEWVGYFTRGWYEE